MLTFRQMLNELVSNPNSPKVPLTSSNTYKHSTSGKSKKRGPSFRFYCSLGLTDLQEGAEKTKWLEKTQKRWKKKKKRGKDAQCVFEILSWCYWNDCMLHQVDLPDEGCNSRKFGEKNLCILFLNNGFINFWIWNLEWNHKTYHQRKIVPFLRHLEKHKRGTQSVRKCHSFQQKRENSK